MKRTLALFSIVSAIIIGGLHSNEATRPVLILNVKGVINPVIAEYIETGISKAEAQNAAAVMIELDTPGGLLDATRSIIEAMINTDIPVIVYVSPSGARATSAGVFITIASDLAVMAPTTHLGAAHPVTIGGNPPPQRQIPQEKPPAKDSSEDKKAKKDEKSESSPAPPSNVMEEKMVSDAAAYIRTLARKRGRNAEWAEKAVRESVSLTEEEAVKMNVVDFVAPTREALLEKAHGREIKKKGKTITLNVNGSPLEFMPMTAIKRFLHMLAHPNVAYILMTIGVYGLIYELASPGVGFGGIVGVICLLLAFFSLQVLPINMVGLILILLGIGLFVTDLFTVNNGLFTLGGLICFALGSFMLIDVPPDMNYPRVSPSLIIPTVLATGLFVGLGARAVVKARRSPPTTGLESLIGMEAEVREKLKPEGFVFLNGELWKARALFKKRREKTIAPGVRVVVKRIKGTKLFVEKIDT